MDTIQSNWLKEQRKAGGFDFGSSIMLTQAYTEEFIGFFIKRVEQEYAISLDFHKRYNGYEIHAGDQIIWFGRPEDVELLRTVKVGLFEEILIGRIERLKELELIF